MELLLSSKVTSLTKTVSDLREEIDHCKSGFSRYWTSRIAYVTTREMGDFFIQATNDIKARADPEGIWTATATPELLTVADPDF